DGLVQPRFEIAAGVFGINRVRSEIGGHEKIRTAGYDVNSNVKAGLQAVADAKHDYAIAFLHVAHKPGTPVTSKSGNTLSPEQAVDLVSRNAKPFKPGLGLLFLY